MSKIIQAGKAVFNITFPQLVASWDLRVVPEERHGFSEEHLQEVEMYAWQGTLGGIAFSVLQKLTAPQACLLIWGFSICGRMLATWQVLDNAATTAARFDEGEDNPSISIGNEIKYSLSYGLLGSSARNLLRRSHFIEEPTQDDELDHDPSH